jgi:hypothetical protein
MKAEGIFSRELPQVLPGQHSSALIQTWRSGNAEAQEEKKKDSPFFRNPPPWQRAQLAQNMTTCSAQNSGRIPLQM